MYLFSLSKVYLKARRSDAREMEVRLGLPRDPLTRAKHQRRLGEGQQLPGREDGGGNDLEGCSRAPHYRISFRAPLPSGASVSPNVLSVIFWLFTIDLVIIRLPGLQNASQLPGGGDPSRSLLGPRHLKACPGTQGASSQPSSGARTKAGVNENSNSPNVGSKRGQSLDPPRADGSNAAETGKSIEGNLATKSRS